MKPIVLTGTSGQVGFELQRALAPFGPLLTPQRAELDLAQPDSVSDYLRRVEPGLIVNPAAYTAVDKAESEPALADAINRQSVARMAAYCAERNSLLVHYSTDYVFDGSQPEPYESDDATNPVSVYGTSKWQGEQAIRQSGARHLILRTSWVYAPRGKNFLLTMLRLARERDELKVVADQFGAPTSARLIADTTAQLLARRGEDESLASTLHLTAAGRTSWHGFASRIVERGAALGLCKGVPVKAIGTADYPTPAKRPLNSSLSLRALESRYGLQLPPWEQTLENCLLELAK